MKPLIALALGMILASSALAQAPEKPNEAFVSVGTGPFVFVVEEMADIFGMVLTLGAMRVEAEESSPQLMVGYQHRLNRFFGAGVAGSWASKSATVYLANQNLGEVRTTMTTLVLEGRGHWLSRPMWDLYSGLGLGFALRNEEWKHADKDDTKTEAALHLTYLGVRVGGDVGGFLEVGGAHNSILAAGLSARF
jgi:hypothetical protein